MNERSQVDRVTQAEVGRQTSARQACVSKVESGEQRLDPVELAQFAAVYGTPLAWFLAPAALGAPARGGE